MKRRSRREIEETLLSYLLYTGQNKVSKEYLMCVLYALSLYMELYEPDYFKNAKKHTENAEACYPDPDSIYRKYLELFEKK